MNLVTLGPVPCHDCGMPVFYGRVVAYDWQLSDARRKGQSPWPVMPEIREVDSLHIHACQEPDTRLDDPMTWRKP